MPHFPRHEAQKYLGRQGQRGSIGHRRLSLETLYQDLMAVGDSGLRTLEKTLTLARRPQFGSNAQLSISLKPPLFCTQFCAPFTAVFLFFLHFVPFPPLRWARPSGPGRRPATRSILSENLYVKWQLVDNRIDPFEMLRYLYLVDVLYKLVWCPLILAFFTCEWDLLDRVAMMLAGQMYLESQHIYSWLLFNSLRQR